MIAPHETELEFSKNGLKAFFEEMDQKNQFEPLSAGKDFEVKIARKTRFCDENPCFRTQFRFQKANFKNVVKGLVNNRDLWDGGIEYCFDIRKPMNRL